MIGAPPAPLETHAAARVGAAMALALCAAIAFLDGFDTQAIGPAGPAIAKTLGLDSAAVGEMVSVSQLGFLIGAPLFGVLGDRIGRKRALLVTAALFAGATLATAFAVSWPMLLLARVAAGAGLGGASPNFVSLASEFAPSSRRAQVVTMLWAAVPLGGVAGSLAGAWLLPHAGWQAVFFAGALLPLPVLLAIFTWMPESHESAAVARAPVAALFARDARRVTAWLWLTSFTTWAVLVVSALWLPALLEREGFAPGAAAGMLALSNGGGVLGTLLVGFALGRTNALSALRLTLTGAALLTLAFGFAAGNLAAVAALALGAGFCTSAAGGTVLAVAAGAYPPAMRATAVGWALAIGRTGTVLGPLAVGRLVEAGAATSTIFATIAAVAVAGALAARALARATNR